MPSLFHPADRDAIAQRLACLEPTTPRLWGRMDAAQMLAHCALGLEVATGHRPMKQALLGRLLAPLIRGRALGEKPWRKNGPTSPLLIVADARDLETERIRLATLLDRFVRRGPEAAGQEIHGFFGRLSGEEWGCLMHKHLDHHLRQFGV